MRKYFSVVVLCMLFMPAFGAGRSMVGNGQAAPRAIVSPVAKISSVTSSDKSETTTGAAVDTARATTTNVETTAKVTKVNRDKERAACISNNIGVGNTFVWASRNSNTMSYSSMVEDTENPENNVCYVLVGMRSDDSSISTADIQPQYFEWGNTITCGSWIDKAKMEERILEAKKSSRTWGTVAGSVGGAGIGFGAMELFGNKLLSKAIPSVQGEKYYTEYTLDWYKMRVGQLQAQDKEKNTNKFDEFKQAVIDLANECVKNYLTPNSEAKAKCTAEKYKGLLQYCVSELSDCPEGVKTVIGG